MTRVLVTGATGQDAYYLMPKLAAEGFEVFGMVRNQAPERFEFLREIPFLTLVQGDLLDYGSLVTVATQVQPNIVINLAGITSPAAAWGTPELTFMTNGVGATRFVDLISSPGLLYIQAGSIAEFGPYGASKLFAQKMMDDFRARGFPVSTIRFGGHHSPRRSTQFFSRRVTQSVAKIKLGLQDRLDLGPLHRLQDWGAAPDFMDALIKVISLPPGTYTVSTNDPHTLEQFVAKAFDVVGLDWNQHVKAGDYIVQPFDVERLTAKASRDIDWKPTYTFNSLIEWLVEEDLRVLSGRA